MSFKVKTIKRFIHYSNVFEYVLVSLCLMAVLWLIITEVIAREVFDSSLHWSIRTAVYLMMWGGFLGATLACNKNSHLKSNITEKIFDKKYHKKLQFIRDLISSFFCFSSFFVSCSYIFESYEQGDIQPIINLPLWVIQIVIPYVFFSMGLRYLLFAFFPELINKKHQADVE